MDQEQQNNRLTGKVAIVTGASSGIGRAVARDLASAGVKLVVAARRAEPLEAIKNGSEHVEIIQGDVTDESLPQALIDKAMRSFGSCDIVVHAAGMLNTGTIEEVDIDEMCRMVRINTEASVRLTYTVMKHFKKAGSGHLVHLSSILGTKTRPGAGVYAGTKYSIEALVESLRMELAGTKIKVSAVQPGVVLTELHNRIPVHPTKSLNITQPLQPEDIAACIRFILTQPDHVRIPVMMVLPGEQSI